MDVRQFLEELSPQLIQGEGALGRAGPVRTDLVADDLEIDPDKLAPLALFAVEALTQARKAAAANGGAIHIRFRVEGSEVRLEIADNGTGMPPQILENIFDPFFTTKEFGKGSGLGLSTALAISRPRSPAAQALKSLLTPKPHADAWGYMLPPVTQAR